MARSDPSASPTEHLWILGISLAAIIGSFVLQPSVHGLCVSVPGLGEGVRLPETCMSLRLFGISCPGCGLTRSFVAMARGEVVESFHLNPMGPVLFGICCFQLPYRVFEILGLWKTSTAWNRFKALLELSPWAILGGLMVGWLVRLVGWV